MTEQPPDQPIQNALTLAMKARCAASWAELRQAVEHLQSLPGDKNPVVNALDRVGTVHFARFAFLEDEQRLLVITSYDGDFAIYINDFINEIGDVFNTLLSFVADAPPLPVQTYRQEFLEYVQRHDLRAVGTFYSAYPNHTVLDILDMASARS